MRISDWSSDVCSSDLKVPTSLYESVFPRRQSIFCVPYWSTELMRSTINCATTSSSMRQTTKLLASLISYLVTSPASIGSIRSEEHTSELQSLMRISYAVFCLKKKKTNNPLNQLG